MARYAVIEGDSVVNIIEAETQIDGLTLILADDTTQIHGKWDGKKFLEPIPPIPTRDDLKKERDKLVDSIKVTTQAGNTFDGNEISQDRMSRAIIGLSRKPQIPIPTIIWVLADNTIINATADELSEALILAGEAQASIWIV